MSLSHARHGRRQQRGERADAARSARSTPGTSANSGSARATRNTPAVTMVAAWISAETGVGPSIASGSQTWSGNCARLADGAEVDQEHDRGRGPRAGSGCSLRHAGTASSNSKVPVPPTASRCPATNPRSPSLVDPERLHRRARRRRPLVPEADQQVRAETDQLPEHEHLEEGRREHEPQHREREERLVGVVAARATAAARRAGRRASRAAPAATRA